MEQVTVLKPKDIKPSKAAKSKVSTKDKQKGTSSDEDMLATLIQTGGLLIVGITGRQHWAFTDAEAYTIANPAAAMLSKLTAAQKKKIEKFTAPAMLAAAVASVIIPKVAVDIALTKGARQNVRNTQQVIPVRDDGVSKAESVAVTGHKQPTGPAENHTSNNPIIDPTIAGLFNTAN